MRALIDLQKKLFPDLLEIMQRRYQILHFIQLMEPVGRRSLADNMAIAERTVRSEVDFLNQQGFIEVTLKGMHLTYEGKGILEQLADFIKDVSGIDVLENRLREKLHLDHVVVVPGDSDELPWVKQELGKACVSYLKNKLTAEQTVAITGGSTMAAVAEMMTPFKNAPSFLFVPARGGLGERVENQANTICAEMAKKARGDYRLLYVPDPISEESYSTITEEPSVKEVLDLIKNADTVIHGIGNAVTMAERRKTPPEQMEKIKQGQAVGEAFGYYFNQKGEIVHKVRTVGLQLEDLSVSQHVIAVAGGESKADAIASYFKPGKSNVLVTDEGAAQKLLRDSSL
ncbi:sugar-binding transcriptional regulator [Thalassobacillus pellis]|uniref:sugar-binding transcriptional regulator n=1 Tax=Thalassobacillus pellis TaxID=748008 RepID=UPI00195F59CD|nr:sugar-binding domain-containing protein [Thalassobacillus pellis]MBM7551350.1 central glycolytic genes regulator [Thalassobacillus pellis]